MSREVKILLVDDQPDFIETISFWMKTKGYQVVAASDGPSALEVLKKTRSTSFSPISKCPA